MKATAAVLEELKQPLVLSEVDIPDPGPTEVRVRLTATGICGSDLHVLDGTIPFATPSVVGHEGAGVVEAIGAAVTSVAVGDKVGLIAPSCGHCAPCLNGHQFTCADSSLKWGRVRGDGSPAVTRNGEPLAARFLGQSSFATHTLVEERTVLKAPAGVPDEVLAPLGCGVVTGAGAVMQVLKPQPGESLVILGAGPVGLSALMAALNTAAAQTIVVDVSTARLDLARELGASVVVNGKETEDLVGTIKELTGGGANMVLETTGVPALLQQSTQMLPSRLGRLGVVGAPGPDAVFSWPTIPLVMSAAQINGVVMGDGNAAFVQGLMDLYLAGRFPVDRLVQTYSFEDINQAIDDAVSGRAIKPVITF